MKLTRLLAFRLLAGIVVLMIVSVSALTLLVINVQTVRLERISISSALRISDVVKRSTHYSMLLNRREDIYHIINTLGSEPGIGGIRIYNKKGEISFSTTEKERGTVVDMNAEACYVCHSRDASVRVTPSNTELVRHFTSPNGERMIGVITPIRNQQSCYQSDCHAHTVSQTVLGVLDVILPLSEMDKNIAELKFIQYAGAGILLVLLTSFCGVFIWRLVNIPVHRLREGTEEVMKGNLDHAIDVQTNDEIGSLTTSFNHMTRTLKQTQEELTLLNQTLEERVQKKTEELRRAQANLIQVEKMVSLGTLAATVAHELNNPLEGILTYAKLIRKRLQNGSVSEQDNAEIVSELKMIADETSRCGTIVKNLLLFSRRKVGEMKENDLRAIMDQSLKLIDHHLKMNNITIEKNFDPQLKSIYCDAEQITQALIALEINAVEAMPQGGELRVALLNTQAKGITMTISDTGTGIRDEDIPHIFEPFFTTKREGKGTGLGLAVVYGIIERHSGTITVNSAPNKGTTFTITLPAVHLNDKTIKLSES
ncbi:MAG: HAMP domain-containing protein [Ignavibacteriales bacterium]|nr:HAMP domain-containing protein [Ignavibacteriales bacterium]